MFFVLGVSHKVCPVEIREKLHFASEDKLEAHRRAVSDERVLELMIVSTCNRVECYGYSENAEEAREFVLELFKELKGVEPKALLPFIYFYEGVQTIRHLFRVAAGLDSLVVGENEILGQVKDAFRLAHQTGAVHSLLYRLSEKALKLGKNVRNQTNINKGAVSIPSVAVELAQKIFGRLSGEKVMVLGTGEMARLTLDNLRTAGADIRVIASRNEERGRPLAATFHADWVSMNDWPGLLEEVDIVIASTAAPHPIVLKTQIENAMAKRKGRPLFLIDIAVPRNIETEVHRIDEVYLYDVDDLQGVSSSNLKLRRKEVGDAEAMVEVAVNEYQSWLEQLEARPMMEKFDVFLSKILKQELEQLGTRAGIDEKIIEETRDRIKSKMMHEPFMKIKDASRNGGVKRYLEAIESLFNLK